MPTSVALEMTDDQVERIFKWAIAGIKQLSVLAPNSTQVATLTKELKADYARAMNKMIFDDEVGPIFVRSPATRVHPRLRQIQFTCIIDW